MGHSLCWKTQLGVFVFCRDELPEEVKAAAAKLGYNQKYWDRDKQPKESDEYWKDLTPEQQE